MFLGKGGIESSREGRVPPTLCRVVERVRGRRGVEGSRENKSERGKERKDLNTEKETEGTMTFL